MKNASITLLAGIGLATTAFAGPDYSAKSSKEVISPCLWSWVAGGSIGYVENWDEEIYTLHLGREYICPDKECNHAFYLEVGYTETEFSKDPLPTANASPFHSGPVKNVDSFLSYDLDIEIIPVTLNYKYECSLGEKINWYAGAGAGVAFVDADFTTQEAGDAAIDNDDDDTVFFAHIFAGVVYNINPAWETFCGARLLFMDDPDFNADLQFHEIDQLATVDGNFMFELGARFNW